VGPEHTGAKLLALAGTLVLIALLLPIYPHRIEGSFRIRSEEVAILTAPFQGYIRSVAGRPGDALTNGAAVLSLDTDSLVLEEAAAVADQTRYLREAEKARANRNSSSSTVSMVPSARAISNSARA
jgi:multidrug resistance efflux pump